MKEYVVSSPIDIVEMKIKQQLKKENLTIFSVLDQHKEAHKVGLELPFTRLILFGNPQSGTLLMQQNDFITFDLPLKLLLIDHKGQTKIIYREPHEFANAKALDENGKVILQKMSMIYESLIEAVK